LNIERINGGHPTRSEPFPASAHAGSVTPRAASWARRPWRCAKTSRRRS